MSRRYTYSLRRHIWLVMMSAAVVLAILVGSVVYEVITYAGEKQLLEEHQLIAANLDALAWVETQGERAHYLVEATPDGWQRFWQDTYLPGRPDASAGEQLVKPLTPDASWQAHQLSGRHDTQWLISYLPAKEQYLVSVFCPALRRMVLPIAGLMVIIVLLGLAHTVMVSRCVIRPLHLLADYAADIAAGRWQPPVSSAKSPEEIGELIEAMNAMQSQLQRNEAEQQAFLQSISHDLKTPVTVIMGHAQAILDGVYVNSLEHNAAVIEEEARRLENKISKILYYNTLDYSLSNNQADAVTAADELLEDLAARFSALAPHLHWQVQTEPAQIAADEENLRVALENILDNALRYARTTISLHNSCQQDQVIITIANDGPPITEARRERIFDQLSKDASGNFGLGLFISRKIITHYGGEITAENMPGGVSFQVTLPLNKEME